jgi:hypothetical protein
MFCAQGIGGDFEAKIEELAATGAGVVVAADEEVDERYCDMVAPKIYVWVFVHHYL